MHADTTSHEQQMLQTHPRGVAFDEAALPACLDACLEHCEICADMCRTCADACKRLFAAKAKA